MSKFLKNLKWSGLVFGGLVVLLIVVGLLTESPQTADNPSPIAESTESPSPSLSPTPVAPRELRTISGEGFLRLPNTNDPEQVLFLAPTPEIYDDVSKMFLAKDFSLGALEELATKGVFGVSNGSRVRVLDRTFTLTRVRILEGVRPIDSDKIERSGWLPREWVVDR